MTQLGIGRAIAPGLKRMRFSSADIVSATVPERFRMVIEELGPTFIKLGQIVSTRGDLLPPEVIRELEKLQDAVPPVPLPLVQSQVERELKRPLGEVFADFGPTPSASASLGQVHAATLISGEPVAVKVQRPGIERTIEVDLDILLELASLAQKRTRWGEHYGVRALVEEFAATLRGELNYEQEGHNMDRFRLNLAADDIVRVPRVFWDVTSRRVLTMERIEGIKITNLAALEDAGLDSRVIAKNNIDILLKSVLAQGFFHADPHPGNFVVMPGEVIGIMDFGIMGHLDPEMLRGVLQIFVGLFRGDTERTVAGMAELGIATKASDRSSLTRDMDQLRQRYYGLELEKMRARTLFDDLMRVVLRNRLRLPSNLVLLFKTIAMLEGVSLQLDPHVNVFTQMEPYVRDALLELESPAKRVRKAASQVIESAEALLALPAQVQRLIEGLQSGDGGMSMRIRGLDEPLERASHVVNRLVLAVLAVAFVIGPALIIPYIQQIWPEWQGAVLVLILGGFFLSVLITLALMISILRSGG
ncbi:MAG TPA: AarF/ABC1/UbiB kinase family protein [Anaerolineae bacterium]|nr:AarF/ABC1/UbiB kinase family protein [Anaerolineae bacterium]